MEVFSYTDQLTRSNSCSVISLRQIILVSFWPQILKHRNQANCTCPHKPVEPKTGARLDLVLTPPLVSFRWTSSLAPRRKYWKRNCKLLENKATGGFCMKKVSCFCTLTVRSSAPHGRYKLLPHMLMVTYCIPVSRWYVLTRLNSRLNFKAPTTVTFSLYGKNKIKKLAIVMFLTQHLLLFVQHCGCNKRWDAGSLVPFFPIWTRQSVWWRRYIRIEAGVSLLSQIYWSEFHEKKEFRISK